jgi:hypothetical protein
VLADSCSRRKGGACNGSDAAHDVACKGCHSTCALSAVLIGTPAVLHSPLCAPRAERNRSVAPLPRRHEEEPLPQPPARAQRGPHADRRGGTGTTHALRFPPLRCAIARRSRGCLPPALPVGRGSARFGWQRRLTAPVISVRPPPLPQPKVSSSTFAPIWCPAFPFLRAVAPGAAFAGSTGIQAKLRNYGNMASTVFFSTGITVQTLKDPNFLKTRRNVRRPSWLH